MAIILFLYVLFPGLASRWQHEGMDYGRFITPDELPQGLDECSHRAVG